ncbi:DEP domain-containing protein 5 [Operophtera brumata]|uniref:DEP domain-containing protein 5 n=1 Tax=Operophtera brumata TaxID=104452 RepID=A0A0L7L6W3_OPEBR|nr:DEP domain-containing protein 5 [Operophtera brumata]
MKSFKLIVHHLTFSPADLVINLKDYPELKEKDIVEIYHPENDYPRLLLQVAKVDVPARGRDTISVEQSIATTFQLRTFADVYVNIVNVADVALDSVELTFRDQYMGRSEMWRLKNSLMWSQGDRVACGVITEDTKIVFRSSTSMVYLFIQMSSEMWDFDIHGDLYFEKAVNGFLADLFAKWKKNGSNHEVTIVLFSRTFYKAKSLEEFPQHMKDCLQKNYRGRFYEDFYSVVITPGVGVFEVDRELTNVTKQRIIDNGVGSDLVCVGEQPLHAVPLLKFHNKDSNLNSIDDYSMPHWINLSFYSTNKKVAYSNFIPRIKLPPRKSQEPLRKMYEDEKKGKLMKEDEYMHNSIFDYDAYDAQKNGSNHEVTIVLFSRTFYKAKSLEEFPQHMKDCLQKNYRGRFYEDFYSVVITPGVGVFEVDRELTNVTKQRIIDNGVGSDLVCVGEQPLHAVPLLKFHNKDSNLNSIDDYSMPHWINLSFYSTNKKVAYSNFIPRIKLPPRKSQEPLRKMYEDEKKGKLMKEDEYMHNSIFDYDAVQRVTRTKKTSVAGLEGISRRSPPNSTIHHRKMSDPDIHHSVADILTSATFDTNSDATDGPLSSNRLSPRSSISSHKPVIRTGRALINPFDPSHVTVKLTSNRRRWTHIFPKGPTGVLIQQHHYQARPAGDPASRTSDRENNVVKENGNIPSRKRMISTSGALSSILGPPSTTNNASLALLWGATGEQEWTPALTTGVDWKSLTIPACLPITTDYFPDKRSLQNDYLVSDYNLLPDDVNADFAQNRAIYKEPLTTMEVFKELVSQRLAQLIVGVNENEVIESHCPSTATPPPSKVAPQCSKPVTPTKRYLLSIGRIFHKLTLVGSTITTYNWNYMDHYICTRGDTDFALVEPLKYWRFRTLLLPMSNPATKKILEDETTHCNIYPTPTRYDLDQLTEGFLKMTELYFNKVKRPNKHRQVSPTKSLNNSHCNKSAVKNAVLERTQSQTGELDDTYEDGVIEPKLKANASLLEIMERMRHPTLGVGFLQQTVSLPSHTFVSIYAIHWLQANMEAKKDNKVPIYKNTHLDIDVSNKSDRIEWGHARYQATFRPDQAYEMCIQWAVASGNIVADLGLDRVGPRCYQATFRPDQAYEMCIQWAVASGNTVADLVIEPLRSSSHIDIDVY